MTKYFFVLGGQPALSIAELTAVFNLNKQTDGLYSAGGVFIIEREEKIEAKDIIRRLGGIIKIGEIKIEAERSQAELFKKIIGLLKPADKKFKFGFSDYSGQINLKPLAMEIKNYLRGQGVSSRWVVSREKTLSSVVVEQNDLTGDGMELILLERGNKILIGQTLAVQPFKELSRRDYGRPARDDHSGMLPPKLAQIMINLARAEKNEILLDPFCGSGTILTEALLMGYRNLIGSDISKKALADTKKNVEWIASSFKFPASLAKRGEQTLSFKLLNADTIKLSGTINKNSVAAIVTEPYLGPPRNFANPGTTIKELENLYRQSLSEFKKILKPGGRIVMVWPVFIAKTGNLMLGKNIVGDLKIVYPLPKTLDTEKIKLTNRQTIIYGRPGQRVWREIVILEK